MTNSMAVKKNLSSIQVLKTFLLLLEDDYTMAELVDKLNSNEDKNVFNNSVVSKYINTCRYLGINIPKIQNKYYVASLPFGLEFTNREVDLIDDMQNTGKSTLSVLFNRRLFSFMKKLRRYSNKNIIRVDVGAEDNIRKNFEFAINEQRQIRLMYRSKEIIECNPVDIIMERGKYYFVVKHSGKNKQIALDRITGLEVLNKKFLLRDEKEPEIVFKLTGGLAKRYSLRENEEILDKGEDYIVVSNKGEPQNVLIQRLLRYDSLCEVLQPVLFREEMKNIISKMLANYEV